MASLKLLITGINGLIGTILRNALQDRYDIYGVDREGDFSDRVLQADVADYQQIADAIQQFSPLGVIVHLAGNPLVKNGNSPRWGVLFERPRKDPMTGSLMGRHKIPHSSS